MVAHRITERTQGVGTGCGFAPVPEKPLLSTWVSYTAYSLAASSKTWYTANNFEVKKSVRFINTRVIPADVRFGRHQRCRSWSFAMDKLSYHTLYSACDCSSMLVLKLTRVSKRDHSLFMHPQLLNLWILFAFESKWPQQLSARGYGQYEKCSRVV